MRERVRRQHFERAEVDQIDPGRCMSDNLQHFNSQFIGRGWEGDDLALNPGGNCRLRQR